MSIMENIEIKNFTPEFVSYLMEEEQPQSQV
jgi:hypothetical protein